jgi:hypothetical protein
MKKKTTSKLALKKTTVTHLSKSVQEKMKGGIILLSVPCTVTCLICNLTQGNCDMPTIGHDDGSYCISKDPKAWCGGIG